MINETRNGKIELLSLQINSNTFLLSGALFNIVYGERDRRNGWIFRFVTSRKEERKKCLYDTFS